MIKSDSKLGNIIKDGIIKAKQILCNANDIQDNEIFSIKNDAIFILNKELQFTDFGIFKFNKKNTYNSFIKIKELEVYHGYDPLTNIDTIDVKGINDNVLEKHSKGWILFLINIFYSLESGSIDDVLRYFNDFYKLFIDRNADKEMYREFNSDSLYRIEATEGTDFILDYINDNELKYVSIKNNIKVLRELHSIITAIYFQKKR